MSTSSKAAPSKPDKPRKDRGPAGPVAMDLGSEQEPAAATSLLPNSKPPPPPPPPLPASLPASKPPPPPPKSSAAQKKDNSPYETVKSSSPSTSFEEPAPLDQPTPSSKSSGGKNPFRDSYKTEETTGRSNSPARSANPFTDSYDGRAKATENSSKSHNPFRDSYNEDASSSSQGSSTNSVNPFNVDVRNDNRDSKLVRQSPKTKQTVSRANPILALQNPTVATATAVAYSVKDDSTHGSEAGADASEHGQEFTSERAVVAASGLRSKGEPGNPIYYLNRFSDWWMLGFLFVHIGQFTLLLNVGYRALPDGGFGVVLILAFAVVVMVLVARYLTKKSRLSERRNIELNNGVCTPNDEADVVPDLAVLLIAAAAITEGFAFAIFSSVSSGNYQYLDQDGFYTKGTLLQVLRFTSITLLALHRTLRPANRLDPMRTVLELEVIAVCWDALDGSTLYELLDGNSNISSSTANSVRALMAAWYVSVGFRIALMFLTNLSPNNFLQRMFVTAPFQLATQPTVDRTLQGLRLKSIITITMAAADLYAAFLRTVIWSNGHLDALQQDMCIKNYLFLSTVAGAYYNFQNTSKKEWNARELLDYPCEVKIPRREYQLVFFRWAFVLSYMLIAALATSILMTVTDDGHKWTANLILDGVLLVIFLVYARNAHKHNPNHTPTPFFIPHEGFFTFPGIMATVLSVLLGTSLMGARLPALYYHYNSMAPEGSGESYTYDNAMLLVVFTIVPLACFGNFWAISYMLFRKEFTAAPGNYHAIHDPSINMVASATVVEGALDVLSSATLMQLAANDLPDNVNNAIVLFCLLELINAGQCFALPCLVSGGKEDTPKDLVRYNAYLRAARGLIDFGTIVLRVVLWIQYRAVSSVFLVKNLYNLIHTATQVDRHLGVRFYPDGTLFSEYVPSYDWYGMSRTQWRNAIYSERSTAAPASVAGAVSQAASLRV